MVFLLLIYLLLRFFDFSTVIKVIEQKVQILFMVLRHHVLVYLHILFCVNLELDLVLAMNIYLPSRKIFKSLNIFIKMISCSCFSSVVYRYWLGLCSLMHEI